MKIRKLRNWCKTNGMEDKWYVSVTGGSDPTIYNLESVEKIAKDFSPADIHIVHVTQTPIDGQSGWVKLGGESVSRPREGFINDELERTAAKQKKDLVFSTF